MFRAIERWATCDECTNGERNAVKAYGERAVSLLRQYLKEGPDSERRAIRERKLRANYAAHPGTGVSEAEYVANLMANYVATYQIRSAVSLGDIGTPDARKALDEAGVRSGYRQDVARVIQSVRSGYASTRFGGTVSPAVVAFGDTINLTPPVGQTFSGNTLLGVDGQPLAFGDAVLIRQPNRLALAAVGGSGGHLLEIRGLGSGTTPLVAPITIRTSADANDRSTRLCIDADTACLRLRAPQVSSGVFPFTTFLSLQRGVQNDSLDYFKIQSSSAIPVTAKLDWNDSSNLDLTWRNCLTFGEEGNLNGATSQKPEATTVNIPTGQCWFLLVKMRSAGSAEPTFARLRLTSP
jgi:hypothetical protein